MTSLNFTLPAAFERPDFENRTALIFLGARLTFGEIAAEGRRVAAGLQSLGVRKGDLIALHLKNSPKLFAALLGCWWAGAVAVPIRHWQSAAMTVSWCNHLGVACLLVEESLVEKVAPHFVELTSCRAIISTSSAPLTKAVQPWDALTGNDGRFERVAVDAREPVILIHTSGTTSRPKAVAQSLHALNARACGQFEHLPFEPQDVLCVFSDCTHGKGLHFLSTPALAVGATVLLVPEFDATTVLRDMKKHGATVTGGAPAYIRSLVEAARREPEHQLPKLRFALSSSDKLPENFPGEWQELFKGPLLEGGGMTETCGPIFSNRLGDTRVGTIGRPYPGVQVRIVGPDGRDVPDETGGELWCAGDFMFSKYWGDPDATRKTVVDGWYRTGDQAVRDPDGRYRLLGRNGFMIKRGGIFVSPFEVETALAKHPAVAECLATGVPSEKWGQEVEAFVVLKQTISAADLRAFAAMALGEPNRPVRYWSLDHIPKTSLGKVLRSEIAELRNTANPLAG